MRCIAIFIFLNTSLSSFSQTIVRGLVKDKNQNPISNAILTITESSKNTFLNYGFSDKQGRYEIKFSSLADSVTLEVRLLGYSPVTGKITNETQVVNFNLQESVFELKEFKVKPEPIKKNGDTLSYSVSAFKNKNDRVIADIIRKLPGIEVEPNGRILYQGEPINKYYIEGMDLLEGRYKIANDNLNAEAVTDIEVIENHQPIRMLDSLVLSNKAALNIKLKKNITTTGQLSLATGLPAALWDVNLTPMLFTKKKQFLGSYQTNNIGKNNTSQLMRLTPGIYKDGLPTPENKQDWLGIQQLSNPSFKSLRWLDNNSHLASINILKTLKKDTELRLIADYSNDTQIQQGYTQTLFFTSKEDSIRLTESKYNKLHFNNLKSDLTLQKNTKKKYFKNSLKSKAYWDNQTGLITNNNGDFTQLLENPFFNISNDYKNLLRIGKSIVTLNSRTGFEKTPQSLTVSPGSFTPLISKDSLKNTIRQEVIQTSFFTDNSLQWLKRVKRISIGTEIGFIVEKQKLESAITSPSESFGNVYTNQLNWLNQKYYVNLQSRYRKGGLNVSLETPVHFYSFQIKDKVLNKGESLEKITFEPALNINYQLNQFWATYLSSGSKNGFGDLNQMYYGYILTSYRDINRSDAPLLQTLTLTNSVGISYKNPVNSTFGSLNFSNSKRRNNLIFENHLNEDGGSQRDAIEKVNYNNNNSLGGRLAKYFRTIKTTLTLSASLSSQESVQIINNELSRINLRTFTPNFLLSSQPLSWFGVDYGYKLSCFKNIIIGVPRQKIIQQNHELKLNINPKDNTYFAIINELYNNNFTHYESVFTDLICRQTVGKKKVDLELNWTNIFNVKSLLAVNSGTFSYIETFYRLRPAQLTFKVRFSL
ncbi:hypothetical protein GVN16_15630 [Emticicia sp. CRIBPO]|uniref:carboxypeptidase regulatory-like domain-containing protein n=1 Tax=Emticicia sp. CRIBPO TaxID=2683258 RepID=UPI0014125460|nr:carboxypeptidase regulatory-like domain-containing protein [Emticicia sp. CRIBPO]NBA87203.1 hypothetical protein [Emticicia sp. CRIBPO]